MMSTNENLDNGEVFAEVVRGGSYGVIVECGQMFAVDIDGNIGKSFDTYAAAQAYLDEIFGAGDS